MEGHQGLRVGDRLRLRLEGLGHLGECTATLGDGGTLYVFGGIPGEEVVVEVVRARRRGGLARVVEVLVPSPHRVAPPCPYFWPCTGCHWQHIRYEHQLEMKRALVRETLRRAPVLEEVVVRPTLPSPTPYEYRNHARFTVGPEGVLGFVNRSTREFVPIDRCLLMHPEMNRLLSLLQGRCGETSQLSLRYGVNTGSFLIQPRLRNPEVPVPTGQSHYEEALLGRRFRVASPSFFQVNTGQAERMVDLIRERLGLTGAEVLVDAYAGVGTFAILLAPSVRKAIAIEESPSAVADARSNAEGLPNIQFLQGRVEEVLGTLEERPDVVILDPPRKGCHPRALEALARLAPRRVVYVSCDPFTLARDLSRLVHGPFRVEEVQPVDMFPQTHHIECLAFLSLREEGREPPALTLASASPRRREALSALGLPFALREPGEEEEGAGGPPEGMARRRALAKARQVARQVGRGLVLGADTVVVLGEEVLGKPRDAQEARRMLRALSGREHRVITGVAVVEAGGGRAWVDHRESRVRFRPLTEGEIEASVASGEPLDKAGAYGVQDPALRPAERVEGCYWNVVGLPLCLVADLLERAGLSLPSPRPLPAPAGTCGCPYTTRG